MQSLKSEAGYNVLYVGQNVSKTCQLKILKTWRLLIFLLKKPGDFILNREILKSPKKKMEPMLFLYYLSHYPRK